MSLKNASLSDLGLMQISFRLLLPVSSDSKNLSKCYFYMHVFCLLQYLVFDKERFVFVFWVVFFFDCLEERLD